ncbi:MAG TPA: hypothetical protein GX497_07125 [Bacillus bacterium]|nr:hypothetical protein [Bacillus sp. (in: firmicutes)]
MVTGTVYASQELNTQNKQININLMEEALLISADIYDSLGYLGISGDDVEALMELPEKDDQFYEDLTEFGLPIEITSRNIVPFNIPVNPPSDAQEQARRMAYVTGVAQRTFDGDINSEAFKKEVVYLYLSHYTDNPYYPNFTNAYCDILVAEDRRVYENYISFGTAARAANSMMNALAYFISSSMSIQSIIEDLNNKRLMILFLKDDIDSFFDNSEQAVEYGEKFINSFFQHYNNEETAEELVAKINQDLELEINYDKHLTELYFGAIRYIIGGRNPVPTILVGQATAYFNAAKDFYDKVAISALQYTTSLRIAMRFDEFWH